MNFFRTRQCLNKAVKGSTFCSKHTPEALKKNAEKKELTNNKSDSQKKIQYYVRLVKKNKKVIDNSTNT